MANKIGTHSGTFHCDEVMACMMLKKLPEFAESPIIRTRDKAVLDTCSIVVDVGAEYDHSRRRYDHHQASFNLTMNSICSELPFNKIKLSSAGLIFAHYGKQVIAETLDIEQDHPNMPIIFRKLYQSLIQEVDAIDNGVCIADVKPNYVINTDLASRVGRCNPGWNDTDQEEQPRFEKAMRMVELEFDQAVNFIFRSWLPARSLVKEAYDKRFSSHPSGKLIIFSKDPPIWKDHLLEIESIDKDSVSKPIFCIYPRKDNSWSCQAVPASQQLKFQSRLDLPQPWRGYRDQELDKLIGIEGCVMVHASGFLGIHKNYDGALHMATTALKLSNLI
ncbi:hypothetical protein Ciccas_002354 [Cichlidogyrus casuarinus]|uniref:Uncharacterized protein n=1 Tax=Cichlidogyrus casuarinus TaxID=1844966 RepID=A0ABD2QHH3_9PLAT